ncbi:hypothetical protein H4R20_004512 [Coemansia guatemalensis]|uniref:Uncharacterized protein n=1 Tax=Coemansia guatemalensis TaxID=2761395 RepID=A0A9W8LS04_9FUNG|nr:hypothetical protein H4R20_004512 [Coemansia guatemalensis]
MKRLPILITGILLSLGTAAVEDDDIDDDVIGRLVGARPDLLENLLPETTQASSGDEQAGCISECKDTDQSCKARCLGVPGAASRKTPRKQDINGNLPLNWKADKSSDMPLSGAATTLLPRLLLIVGMAVGGWC